MKVMQKFLLFALIVWSIAAAAAPKSQALHRLFQDYWEYQLKESPESATYLGHRDGLDRWIDMSAPAIERRRQQKKIWLKRLKAIAPAQLNPLDRRLYEVFRYDLELEIAGDQFPGELLPLNQMSGPQSELAKVLELMPAKTVADFELILKRMERMPVLLDQLTALLKRGVEAGVTPAQVALVDVPNQVDALTAADDFSSPLLKPFQKLPESIAEAERTRLKSAARIIYGEQLRPAWRKFGKFLRDEYLPRCRTSIAWTSLPNGVKWYDYLIETRTNLKMSAAEVHAVGLKEVARIRSALDSLAKSVGLKDFAEMAQKAGREEKFFYRSADEALAHYRELAKRVEPELIKYFGVLPRLPYGIEPIPAHMAQANALAYYDGGNKDAARPGKFYLNTSDLKRLPRWIAESLLFHEAVPGHHLQLAISQERENVPVLFRYQVFTSYTEGWGLYAEYLGEEMGFYGDPWVRYGRLTNEIWRAVRLVVDTGMHALGWNRDQAIEYFVANTGRTFAEARAEIDRYIVWPGQALAYKLGEMKILELRKLAETKLGERFSLRAFHDTVLLGGSVPLPILESNVRAWIESARTKKVLGSPRPKSASRV